METDEILAKGATESLAFDARTHEKQFPKTHPVTACRFSAGLSHGILRLCVYLGQKRAACFLFKLGRHARKRDGIPLPAKKARGNHL